MNIQAKSTIPFETARFRLRAFDVADREPLVGQLTDPLVSKQLAFVPHPYDASHAEAWIKDCVRNPPGKVVGCRLAIERREDGAFVGGLGLIPHGRSFELGYWLDRKYWGCGYATEAVGAAVDFGLTVLQMRQIVAFVFMGNPASTRVLSRLGFAYRGLDESTPDHKNRKVLRYDLAGWA
ncbi:MAG: GNAT family N-acetyltransferase [Alphaproteobacteria bacterium]|nr:GNAT family N-acetyltransferase [Alphaproteobacteria bacterium]